MAVVNLEDPMLLDSTGRSIANALEAINETLGGRRKKVIYGFHVNGQESDPASMVTYVADAVGMAPAKMNYTTGVFDYGSWGSAFFMPRPCMLRYDGTVDYYLNPNDLTKKLDGTASDVANTSYNGNAMMEWGNGSDLIWTKVVADATDDTSGTVYIANYKADDSYTCYPFINVNGNTVNHFYTPIYNGSEVSGKLRSISGQTVCKTKTAQQEVSLAQANYSGANIWNTEVYCDRMLINFLLILTGKSLSTKTVFGRGMSENSGSESLLLQTGSMNTKGMFWGESTGKAGVKVFGMENYWGNQWRRYAGHINASGAIKVKMCYGTSDGSTVSGYNFDGSGYVNIGATPSGSSGGYISKAKFNSLGIHAYEASGSSSTKYCDGLWYNNSQTNYALCVGHLYGGLLVGAFCLYLYIAPGDAYWDFGAAPSCKPLG